MTSASSRDPAGDPARGSADPAKDAPSDPPSETLTLLRRWHQGDVEALGRLIERDLPHIRAHSRRRLGPLLRTKEQTGDIVQDAMVHVLRDGPRFLLSDGDQFRALVGRIVENVLRTKGRSIRRERRDPERERLLSTTFVDLDARHTSPSEVVSREEEAAWLELGIQLLSEPDREVIVLRQWEDLSFSQVGEQLGTTGDAARMRFNRALARLGIVLRQLKQGELRRILDDAPAEDQTP